MPNMEIRSFRDNELITGISILAVLNHTKKLEFSKCLLIEPLLSYSRVVKGLSRKNSNIKSIEDLWAMRIKKFCLLGAQPHDAVVSCGCRFAVPAKFRGKINLPDKVIVYVNALGAMAAGFIRGVDNYLFHKLT